MDNFDRDKHSIYLPTIRNKKIMDALYKKFNHNIKAIRKEIGDKTWHESVMVSTINAKNGQVFFFSKKNAVKALEREKLVKKLDEEYLKTPK